MTLRPRLAAPAGEMDERITSGEQEQVNRHAQRWRAALLGRAECRSRVIKVWRRGQLGGGEEGRAESVQGGILATLYDGWCGG